MSPIAVGASAPPITGVEIGDGALAVLFYKVTCPVCQMAAPKVDGFERAYAGRIVGVGQDPPEALEGFSREFGMGFRSVADLEPFEASEAYGIEVVPTLVVIGDDGVVEDVVQSWDREGLNRASRRLAELAGEAYAPISDPTDGLPAFRPG